MACQCGCCDVPVPAEGTETLNVVEVEGAESELQRRVEELDRRVKELEKAA